MHPGFRQLRLRMQTRCERAECDVESRRVGDKMFLKFYILFKLFELQKDVPQ